MNTALLKRFSQQARTKLITQVSAKIDYVLNTDTALLREKANQVKKLQEAINKSSKEAVVEKVAYTWFNRFMALRFMDANNYQPLGLRIVTPQENYTLPEILDQAKQGIINNELPVNQQHILEVLNGTIPSNNAQNEAYKELLIGACNHLNKVFPFLFEKINDYAELLLPNDLTSEFSIIEDIRKGMTNQDCQEVEIIGWIYQFYISEKKDQVFASKSKVSAADIPAATQLFTPRWIVEYMVQNTIGKLWLQNKPNSKLKAFMPYYIDSPTTNTSDFLKIEKPEDITLLDQACGSGHILVYGFELLTKIYEEEGYNQNEIPQLIITNNLFGFEIDERAAQLASLALMMKARSYQRRAFKKELKPNIMCYQDLGLQTEEITTTFKQLKINLTDELLHDLTNMQQASNLGSLIIPHTTLKTTQTTLQSLEKHKNTSDIFLKLKVAQLLNALEQLQLLANKYHCVVDNPPYMGGGKMNKELAAFVKTNYPNSKADLMTCFMEAGLKTLQPKGFLGMINQHSWMFLSSYEKLRQQLIKETFIDTLLHLGARTFPEIGGEVVQNTSFTLWNNILEKKGVYIRLVDEKSSDLKRTKTLEAIQNPNCAWYYTANQKDFKKIPGNRLGYWLSQSIIKSFINSKKMSDLASLKAGLQTGNNDRFVHFWWEILNKKIRIKGGKSRHVPYDKGGPTRKWFGNQLYVLDWKEEGDFLKNNSNPVFRNMNYYFKKGISYSLTNTSSIGFRFRNETFIFDNQGSSMFTDDKHIYYILGFSNSKIVSNLTKLLNPTMVIQVGDLSELPLIINAGKLQSIEDITKNCIKFSKKDWNKNELSFDNTQNELLNHQAQDLEETYDLYQHYWQKKFMQLHKNEEELNRQFIEIYGLEEELTPEVPLQDITILKEETKIVNEQLVFQSQEIFKQFVSYAVGCLFGRYSLDKQGLILANQGETLEDYLTKIQESNSNIQTQADLKLVPDQDNIIPILNDEWFADDIVGQFYQFLKASFGTANFDRNLHFIEDQLGKSIRNYFVKDFYNDHIKRYKKRPIYWQFSSPKGAFNVLIYMHRYTPDTLSQILNNYLKQYREKLKTHTESLENIKNTGTSTEQNKADKEIDRIKAVLLELQEYERDVLYPLATERIKIDLDDGVLVNYNKFGSAIKLVKGLNCKKTKEKVRKFDWIDVSEIRD